MIYAALLTLSPTLSFDCPQFLLTLCRQGQSTPPLCVESQHQMLLGGVVCILGEGAFHLGVQGESRVSAWPASFWALVTVSLSVGNGELARHGIVFCSGQMGVTSCPSESPLILRCYGLCLPFPVGTRAKDAGVLLASAGWHQALGNRGL